MKRYNVGLDIGTNSVGIACADENNKLMRAKGKDCWAVRLFDESNTAAERRTFRTARRRLDRKKKRIGFLQAIFAPFMYDELFFIRLNNSQFTIDDKHENLNFDVNNLFADKNYTDKQFHAEYPTIFHLRKALMSEKITDLRLYYLALHHIIKYRGHFLFEGTITDIRNFDKLLSQLNEACVDVFEENTPLFDVNNQSRAKSILMSGDKDRQKQLEQLFSVSDKRAKEIIKGMCGYSMKPSVLLSEKYKDEKSFDFKKITDEIFDGMQSVYGNDFVLLSVIRAIYNFVTFEKLLESKPDISSAMVALYEKHKNDLQLLKNFLRTNAERTLYNAFFKSTKEDVNYVNYIGYTKKGGDKVKVKKCRDEDFYAYAKNCIMSLNDVKDLDTRNKILSEIDDGTFLPKIIHADNGLFPYQVNEYELIAIINNMVKNCPQTSKMAQKILKIFLFRIPYYVGPLTGKNSWVVRKTENVAITPWNFEDVIDLASSNEAFMRRMTNKCSYLHSEDVIPKDSIYYQKYNVLNQINKLKFNGRAISVQLKQAIFNELFLTKKKVSDNDIKNLFVKHGLISEAEKRDVTISGKDGELKASMSSYIQLKSILGDFVDRDLAEESGVCENIILWHTLNTDKKIVEELIIKNYGKIPEINNNIKQLKGLTFKDFGKLSKKFLMGIKAVDITKGEFVTLMQLLYETNQNLNELLFDERYDFQCIIKDENGEDSRELTYEDIEQANLSPTVRRGIWQSIKMVDEYVAALGGAPEKIFIEVTREDGKKVRTVSRRKQLLEKYKGVEGIAGLTAELNEKTDLQLRQERLYLYFRQLGKCMYTGKKIDLDSLSTNLYDVDHILPRSYIKDDSLDNKVLVMRSKNAEKRDIYPIAQGLVTEDARRHWEVLRQKGLISDNTFKRLTRNAPLTDDDYNDFINRQKTITDQTVKAVAELLKRRYPESKIVYCKAKNVNDFKQKFNLYKCRETNDLHHARDAYLNIVVGNVYDTCFSTPMAAFYRDGDKWRNYNLKTMFERNVHGAWVQENNETLLRVKKTYAKSSMAVTRYVYCNKGGFYDQTIYGHGENSITAPRKMNGPLRNFSKYGGYKSQRTAYFAIVQSLDKKGRKIRTIESVPIMTSYRCKNDSSELVKYFASYLNDPIILIPKLKVKQYVKINGTPCFLAGVSGNSVILHNGVQLFTDNKTDEYVNALDKLVEMGKNGFIDKAQKEYIMKTNRDGVIKLKIDSDKNTEVYDYLLEKLRGARYMGIDSINHFYSELLTGKEKFMQVCTYEQAMALLQALKFFRCNAELCNLKCIGVSAVGRVTINKNITDDSVCIVYQSPCGLTERERTV